MQQCDMVSLWRLECRQDTKKKERLFSLPDCWTAGALMSRPILQMIRVVPGGLVQAVAVDFP